MIPIRSNGMTGFPKVSEKVHTNWFPLDKATICIDASDYKVVNIATQMLADDLERIMTIRPAIANIPKETPSWGNNYCWHPRAQPNDRRVGQTESYRCIINKRQMFL